MKRHLKFYDILVAFFLLAAAFSVILHLSLPEDDDTRAKVLFEAELLHLDGELRAGDVCRADGRFEMTVEKIDGGTLTFACRGAYYPAGFLLDGGKYLTENQPLSFTHSMGEGYCRIRKFMEYD